MFFFRAHNLIWKKSFGGAKVLKLSFDTTQDSRAASSVQKETDQRVAHSYEQNTSSHSLFSCGRLFVDV